MTRIVFLDVDGVLRTDARQGRDDLCEDAVARLNGVLEASGARIVVSSTWRRDADCRTRLVGAGVADRFHEDWRTDPWAEAPEGAPVRWTEIGLWLDRHGDVDAHVVVDDDCPAPASGKTLVVAVDPRRGFTESDADRAIAILNRARS